MRKIIRMIMVMMQYILIAIGILTLVTLIIPMIAGYKPFVVKSGSMEPTVKTGAIAYNNTHAKVEDVKEGDIIVFKQGDSYVTHRVVKINEDRTYTTKGDANETEDIVPVRFENFKGKNVFSIPFLGYALKVVQTKWGVFFFVLITGLNIVYYIFSDDESENDDKKNS